MDERGYLRITDRKKDMFIVGGFNAYPAEIENMILEHPDVAQVAVVGVPDERMGEVGVAFVVPRARRDDRPPTSCVAWCREHDGQLQGAAPGHRRRRAAAQRERQGPEVRAAGAGLTMERRATRTTRAIVTGAGRASAAPPRRASPPRARAVACLDVKGHDDTAAEIVADGGHAWGYECDVTDAGGGRAAPSTSPSRSSAASTWCATSPGSASSTGPRPSTRRCSTASSR